VENNMVQPIPPGSILGIIGGGQLGRMMANAAAELGYRVHIYTPEEDSPASHVAWKTTVAAYDDVAALKFFFENVTIATYEFENVPVAPLQAWKGKIFPDLSVLKICQNRIQEKTFLNKIGVPTALFAEVNDVNEVAAAVEECGLPGIFKTTEMGYDGKGQAKALSKVDAQAAWESLRSTQVIYESFVDFTMEISVIVARNATGIACYIPVQNEHKNHILDITTAPAPISAELSKEAERIANKIAEKIDLVGILAVEMFVTRDGRILVNELAPRPHNSGHWTMDACITSQFEQVVRAVCGLPLGLPDRLCDAQMKNLIGDEVHQWKDFLNQPNCKLHLYGKKEARPGRKMGHVTRLKK